ncbi:MAG: MFS transporter [Thermoplasmata archaeon]
MIQKKSIFSKEGQTALNTSLTNTFIGTKKTNEDKNNENKDVKLAYKSAIASFFGTFLEFYDFTLFGYLAVIIGSLFFPKESTTATLLYYFAIFGVGFVMRPIGALFFGWLGDTFIGRRNTLLITISMMGIVSLAMGLMPTYAEIGIWATILLVIFRLLQGFSLGGEFGGGITLTAEFAPKERRGYFVSIAQLAQSGLLSTGLLYLFSIMMSKTAFIEYGWRILFIFGVVIALAGVYIRIKLTETPEFEDIKKKKEILRIPAATVVTKKIPMMLLVIFLAAIPLSYTFIVFGVTYLTTYTHFSYSNALLITTIASAFFLLITIPAGWLSDKIGRKKVVLFGLIGEAILVIPFYMLLGLAIFSIVLILYIIEELFHGIYNGTYGQMMAEIFPTNMRYTGIALSYNLGVGIIGGFTPFILTYLITVTHNTLAPLYWLIPLIIVPIIMIFIWYKETKGKDLATLS